MSAASPLPPPVPPAPTPAPTAPPAEARGDDFVSIERDATKLVVSGKGIKRFLGLPVTCISREEHDGVVIAVLVSDTMGAAVVKVSDVDASSLQVLRSLPFRDDKAAADRVLNRLAEVQGAGPKTGGTPVVAGSAHFDGHVLAFTIDGKVQQFLPDDDQRPRLIGRSTDEDGSTVVELDLSGSGRIRLRIPTDALPASERALLLLKRDKVEVVSVMWEYKVVKNMLASSLESQLNSLGHDGWELVSMTGLDGVMNLTGNKLVAVLKRERRRRPR